MSKFCPPPSGVGWTWWRWYSPHVLNTTSHSILEGSIVLVPRCLVATFLPRMKAGTMCPAIVHLSSLVVVGLLIILSCQILLDWVCSCLMGICLERICWHTKLLIPWYLRLKVWRWWCRYLKGLLHIVDIVF